MAELNNQSLAAVYAQQLRDSQQAYKQYQAGAEDRALQQQAAEAERVRQQQLAAAAAAAEAERTRSRTLGEFAADTGLAALQSATGLGGAFYGGANVLTGGLLDRDLGFSQNLQETQQTLESWKSAPLQARRDQAAQAFERDGLAAGAGEYLTNPSLIFDLGVQSAAYLLPGAAAARFAGGAAAAGAASRGLPAAAQASAAQTAATRASLVSQGALTGGYLNPEAINAARKAGLSEGEQQLAGLGAAAVGAITNPLISKFTGAAGMEARVANAVLGGASMPAKAGSAAARVGAFTTTQAVEEAAQEANERAIVNVAGQRPIGEGVGESAVLGGILGGVLGGAMGLTQIRQPSATRQELADLQAAVETELAGETGAPVVRPSLIRQAALQDAQNKLAASVQARVHPLAQREEIDLGAAPLPVPVEEIDVGAVPVPVPVEEIDVGAAVDPGLTGLNRVVAEQFGPAVAGAEQARRMAAQAPTSVEAPAAPLDLSTPKAVGEYRRSVKQELARATGRDVGAVKGPQFDALVTKLADAGVRPGTPEFNTLVGVETARQLQAVERGGKTNNLLGALNNAYPVTQEQQLDAAFDRGGVPTTEEELFGAEPAAQAPARPAFVDTPAAQVESVEREQQWVSPQGEVYTVAAMFNGRPQLQGPRGNRVTKAKAAMEREGWSLRQPAAQAAQAAAPKPQRDLTVKEQIADLGGILTSYRQDITGDTKASTAEAAPGRGRIFSENGTSPDDMAMQLAERNFVPAEELARDGGVQWLYDAVNRSLAGDKIYAQGSAAQERQFDEQMAEQAAQPEQSADAANPKQVTAAPPRYDARKWADYLTYPGAAQLNAWTNAKEREGNPQPVLAAMLTAIDLSGDMTEFAQVSNAAQAHPEFAMMSQDARSQVSTHMATALNRLTGATFELGLPNMKRPVDQTELQRALAMSEDDYIAAINPTGEMDTEEEGIILNLGDLDTPVDAVAVTSFTDSQGGTVSVLRGADGSMYAVQNGQTLGSIGPFEDGSTGIQLVREAQGKGVGRRLTMEYLRENPFAPAGSFTAAGEANRRSAFRALKAEQAKFSQGAKQTDTAAFKRWFGDSKVVGADGKPLVMYHGTSQSQQGEAFTVFDTYASNYGLMGAGGYFTADPEVASSYTSKGRGDTPTVYPVYLAVKNPIDMDGKADAAAWQKQFDGVEDFHDGGDTNEAWYRAAEDWLSDQQVPKYEGAEVMQDALRAMGFDGITHVGGGRIKADGVRHRVYVAFDPTQIKSAIGNTGAFDQANPDIRYSLGTAPVDTGMNKRLFDKGVETAARNYGRPILGFDTVAQLEEQLGFPLPEGMKGVYLNGEIYVVRENIANGKELTFTVAHEVGHRGLEALLGSSLKAATNRMWANADMRKRIRAKMAELNMAQGTEEERRASRTLAAEEVLADMLAGNERLNKDIWSKLRAGVREFLARVFGIRNYVVTNKEVDDLLTDVARVIKGAPAAQVREKMQNPGLWINDANQAAEADPKFSKAKADMDEMLAAGAREGASNVQPFSVAGKALANASINAAKSVWTAVKENKIGGLFTHNLMSLDQMVEWHDKLFRLPGAKTGLLSKVYDLKSNREAEFNRHIGAQRAHQYNTVKDGEPVTTDLGKFSVHDMIGDWDDYKRKNPAKAALLDHVNSEGTFYKVFPDRKWEDQVVEGFDYTDAGYTEEDRKQAWLRVSRAYNALDAQGKTIYQRAQSVYSQMSADRFAAIKAETDRLGKRAEAAAVAAGVDPAKVSARVAAAQDRYKKQIDAIIGRIKQGPYSPLMRFGDYVVTVRDEAGNVVHFSAHESVAERDAAAAEIGEQPDGYVVSTSMTRDQALEDAGVQRSEVEAIRSEVMALLPDDMDPEIRDSAVAAITAGLAEAYLQSLPAKSFAKHGLGRKNVAGYDTNSLRAFSNYTIRGARSIAGIKYDGQIGNAMLEIDQYVRDVARGKYADGEGVKRVDATKLQGVANAVKRQHMAALRMDNNKLSNALTTTAFTYQLTSPSQLLFNATQTPMVAFPRLSGIYGGGRAAKAISKALRDYTASGLDLLRTDTDAAGRAKSVLRNPTNPADAKVLEALQQIKDDGPLDITQAHDVSGIADGSAGELHPYWGKVMMGLSYFMHKSEVFNRQITALAAVRLELEKQMSSGADLNDPALVAELVRIGKRAIDTTQFNFAKFAKPPAMQGPIGKVVLQYRLFQLNMLSTLARDIRDGLFGSDPETKRIARETLAWTMGMQLAFMGTAGTILAPFAFAIADMFREDDDLTTSRQAYVAAVGQFAAHGALAGLLDMGRAEAATLVPILGQGAYAPVGGKPGDTFSYYITQNLGPSFGLAKNLYTGMANVADGEFEKGFQNLLPKPLADVHKAVYDGANGVRNAQDVVYHELSPWGAATQFLGFRSGERRELEGQRSAFYTANANKFEVRDRYLAKLALGYGTGDRSLIDEAMDGIKEWNVRYPDPSFTIKKQDIARAITKRQRQQQVAAETGLVSSRPISPIFDAVLGR